VLHTHILAFSMYVVMRTHLYLLLKQAVFRERSRFVLAHKMSPRQVLDCVS